MSVEQRESRRRGPSPRGNFETAKVVATASEEARVAADKRKTVALRAARLQREQDASRCSKTQANP